MISQSRRADARRTRDHDLSMASRDRRKKKLLSYLGRFLPIILTLTFGAVYALIRQPGGWKAAGGNETALPRGSGMLTVDFIDIGQGDAALIEAPDGQFMIIDAGPPEVSDDLIEWLNARGVKKIRYAVFTHPHADHIGGADEVLLNFGVETVIMPETEFDIPSYYRLGRAISLTGCETVFPRSGDSFELGGASFRILAPNSASSENLNDMSVVLRLEYKNTSLIFTGDAEEQSENEILEIYGISDLKSDVLKVGHHGSSTSSTVRFLQAVMPEYAVISCGRDNDFGHPHAVTLRKLEDIGAAVLRTDTLGTITFVSDGDRIYYIANETGSR